MSETAHRTSSWGVLAAGALGLTAGVAAGVALGVRGFKHPQPPAGG